MSSAARIPTGIDGLDAMIEGGLIRGDMHLLAGAPGTGKTILASTFAYNAATTQKERVVYASFEESTEYLEQEHEEARDRPRRGGEGGQPEGDRPRRAEGEGARERTSSC